MKKSKKLKFPSELRMDLVSEDWVVIATGRAKKPEAFKKGKQATEATPKKNCPFCKIIGHNSVIAVSNKYPAFLPHPDLDEKIEGNLYKKMNAVGFHEVVITRDHKKQMARFSIEEIKEVIDVYQERYLELMLKKFVNYISIFHNQGQEAGASITHPHSQIITTPLIDTDLRNALLNSKKYLTARDCFGKI